MNRLEYFTYDRSHSDVIPNAIHERLNSLCRIVTAPTKRTSHVTTEAKLWNRQRISRSYQSGSGKTYLSARILTLPPRLFRVSCNYLRFVSPTIAFLDNLRCTFVSPAKSVFVSKKINSCLLRFYITLSLLFLGRITVFYVSNYR